jgi:hypothetical protein
MQGSRYNARQVSLMTPREIHSAMLRGDLPLDVFALEQEMEQQEPGILLDLAPEVIEYVEQLKEVKEKEAQKKKIKPSALMIKNQKSRFKKKLPKKNPNPRRHRYE